MSRCPPPCLSAYPGSRGRPVGRAAFERKDHMKSRSFAVALGTLVTAAVVAATLAAAPSALADSCPPPPPLVHPFLPWSDSTSYVLTTGGSFEKSGSDWSRSGGASVVADQEPWHVNASTDSRALGLPAGSPATS